MTILLLIASLVLFVPAFVVLIKHLIPISCSLGKSLAVGVLQDLALCTQILDDLLLMLVDPTGKHDHEKLSGLKDEVHVFPDPGFAKWVALDTWLSLSIARDGHWEHIPKFNAMWQVQFGRIS